MIKGRNLRPLKNGYYSKYPPFAFTEQGVAMLSGVLKSKRAIRANIAIMRRWPVASYQLPVAGGPVMEYNHCKY